MKKSIIGAVLFLVLLISIGTYNSSGSDDIFGVKKQAIKTKEKEKEKNSKNIVKISKGKKNITITDKQLDIYVMNLEFTTKGKVDREVALKKIIRNKELYLLADEAGYSVNDKTVANKLDEVRKIVDENVEQKAFLKNYITGLGIDEDEYYDQIFDSYKENLTIGNYKNNKLKKELLEIEPSLKNKDFTEEFYEKLDGYIDSIIESELNSNRLFVEYDDELSER